jgi:hypothetical protein
MKWFMVNENHPFGFTNGFLELLFICYRIYVGASIYLTSRQSMIERKKYQILEQMCVCQVIFSSNSEIHTQIDSKKNFSN